MLREARRANLSEAVCLMRVERWVVDWMACWSAVWMVGSEQWISVVSSVGWGGHIAEAKVMMLSSLLSLFLVSSTYGPAVREARRANLVR